MNELILSASLNAASEAVETETTLNNGVSPKDLIRSRRNGMPFVKCFSILIACFISTNGWAQEQGVTGPLKWNIKNNTLTISGKGSMPDYEQAKDQPWKTAAATIAKVVIKEGVTSIGKNAFCDFKKITSMDIPNSVKDISDGSFRGCEKLTEFNVSQKNTLFCSVEGILFNKDMTTIVRYPPAKTGTSYTIPSTTTSIGYGAFHECGNLVNIELPENGISIIPDYAFAACSSLTSITIPDGIQTLGDNVFAGCSALKQINLSQNIKTIPDYAFEACRSLTSIIIPDAVTDIGNYAFNDCSSLTNITIPDGVKSLGEGAFAECSALKQVNTGANVTFIPAYAFYNCSSLTNIVVPDGVTGINDYAFSGCNSVTNMEYPKNAKIGVDAIPAPIVEAERIAKAKAARELAEQKAKAARELEAKAEAERLNRRLQKAQNADGFIELSVGQTEFSHLGTIAEMFGGKNTVPVVTDKTFYRFTDSSKKRGKKCCEFRRLTFGYEVYFTGKIPSKIKFTYTELPRQLDSKLDSAANTWARYYEINPTETPFSTTVETTSEAKAFIDKYVKEHPEFISKFDAPDYYITPKTTETESESLILKQRETAVSAGMCSFLGTFSGNTANKDIPAGSIVEIQYTDGSVEIFIMGELANEKF